MVTKTTTLAPPSLSTVLKSNTIQSAPAAASTPTATSTSNTERLAAIRAANQAKSNTPEVFTATANVSQPTNVVL